jgi:hypothetical protein
MNTLTFAYHRICPTKVTSYNLSIGHEWTIGHNGPASIYDVNVSLYDVNLSLSDVH